MKEIRYYQNISKQRIMEQKVKDLTALNARLISFIDTIIESECKCFKRGKHLLLQQIYINEFSDIINSKPIEYIEIDIPATTEEPEKKHEESEINITPSKEELIEKQDIKIDNLKKVSFAPIQKGGTKKRYTNKQRINKKLNKLKAEDVKKVGKKFNIKPESGKRYLTKTHVIDKVSKNTKIYGKVLEHVNKEYGDLVRTETENGITEV
jgi:hypothetical protein